MGGKSEVSDLDLREHVEEVFEKVRGEPKERKREKIQTSGGKKKEGKSLNRDKPFERERKT